MDRLKLIMELNEILLDEMPQYKMQAKEFEKDTISQRRLLRALMNVRPPVAAEEKFLQLQDKLLSMETAEKGVVDVKQIPHIGENQRIALWKGDITRLNADAIVNAANQKLLGCFFPCHGCIDNAIHSAAGVQLRLECAQLMKKQGFDEPTGTAKITKAYHLPCKYVIHTVGPIVDGRLTSQHCEELAACYQSCLVLAAKRHLKSIAFCCISTGEFHFPNQTAAEIAVREVTNFLKKDPWLDLVIFDVFKEEDYEIYREILKNEPYL